MQLIEAKIETKNKMLLVWDEPIEFAGIQFAGYTIVKIEIPREDKRERLVEINGEFQIEEPILVQWQQQELYASTGEVVRTEWFEKKYRYEGKLGVEYTPQATTFHLWAPTAYRVYLYLYTPEQEEPFQTMELQKDCRGAWHGQITDDCQGLSYQYYLQFPNGMCHLTNDPYAIAEDHYQRSSIVSPLHWEEKEWTIERELSGIFFDLEQWTNGPECCLLPHLENSYLGVVSDQALKNETARVYPFLQELPLNSLFLYPLYKTVQEELRDARILNSHYGANATNFSTLQEQFCYMVEKLHAIHKAVVAVMPFEAVKDAGTHPLHLTVPGYYFRYDEQGLIVDRWQKGNELACERFMVQRYLTDTCRLWIEQYHVDGFILSHTETYPSELLAEWLEMKNVQGNDLLWICDCEGDSIEPRMTQYLDLIELNHHLSHDLQNIILGVDGAELKFFQSLMANSQRKDAHSLLPKQVLQTIPPLVEERTEKESAQQYFAVLSLLCAQGSILFPVISSETMTLDFAHKVRQKLRNLYQFWRLREQDTLLHLQSYMDMEEASQILQASDQVLVFSLQGGTYTEIFAFNASQEEKNAHIPSGTYLQMVVNNDCQVEPSTIEIKDDYAMDPYTIHILRRI